MSRSRRDFLKVSGSVVVGAGVVSQGTSASSTTNDHRAAKPDHVTLSWSESWLQQYQPRMVVSHLDIQPSVVYAWKASSPERDTEVGVYWTYYVTQEGVTSWDSHVQDHEPIYVFVDSNGEVTKTVYSGYHWVRAANPAPPTAGSTSPTVRVADNWHHYLSTTTVGVDPQLQSLDAVFDDWVESDFGDSLEPGTVTNPWSMETRSDWWRGDTWAGTFGETMASLKLSLGFDGADNTDF